MTETTENTYNIETSTPRPYRLCDLLAEFDTFADKLETAKKTGKPFGPVTGFESIDRELCGAFSPGLHVVTGNTGAGKTAFCLQMACNCGCPAIYVSCEMSALELLRRITARVTETPLQLLKDPKISIPASVMKARAREAIQAAPELIIADATTSYAHPNWIRDMAALCRERSETDNLLIVIDSLHSWLTWLTGDEYERINFGIFQLQTLAATLNCPVVYIAENNRDANKDNKPSANSAKGSGRIEYSAETKISIITPLDPSTKQPLPADGQGNKEVTVTFDKNRNNKAGVPIKLEWNGAYQRFKEV
jgi:replicative DNA helicase